MQHAKLAVVGAVGGILLGLLAGCDGEGSIEKPVIVDIGVFDGCTVKYVDRGYNSRSFYLARCKNTASIVRTIPEGKSHHIQTVFVDEATVDDQIEKLQQQKQALEDRKAALAKLSAHDQEVLGLTKEDK